MLISIIRVLVLAKTIFVFFLLGDLVSQSHSTVKGDLTGFW